MSVEPSNEERGPYSPMTGLSIRDDLVAINRWLCFTRVRAAVAVAVFAWILNHFDIYHIDDVAVFIVVVAMCGFAIVGLRMAANERTQRALLYAQCVIDVAGITAGIGLGVSGPRAILFHFLFVLVVIPPSLISVPSGLIAATLATIGHGILLVYTGGMSLDAFSSIEAVFPPFVFYLVAQQSFFYGGHLERKNTVLAQLAARLEQSRQRLSAIVDVARTLNSTVDASELLAKVNHAALEHVGADWGATFLIDAAGESFYIGAFSAPGVEGSELARIDFPVSSWPAVGRLNRERVVFLDGWEAAVARWLLTGREQGSDVLLAGLYREGRLAGFLALGYASSPQMRDSIAEQVTAITEHAAIALRNAQLLDEARQASALKSEFLSTISHELRTPLNVILGYTDMLREGAAGPLTEEQSRLFERIELRSRELFDLIEATLQVGRLESGRGAVSLANHTLAKVVEALHSNTDGLPQPSGVSLEWDVPDAPCGTIFTDPAKVALVVRNLVSNGLKFTADGKVVVRVRPHEPFLVIEVADTGVGIPAEHFQAIFEMFRQLDGSAKQPRSGVGLGLYIVKQVVERLRGTIELESEIGKGSTFRIRLPHYSVEPTRSGLEHPQANTGAVTLRHAS